tara:strand:+ start:467 stop:709 length:243 start_codon:yes stop_codon:yes gene_type:complete
MDKQQIIKAINPIFKNIFDDENLEINENSNSDNIDGWDSLNHILLVVEIEKKLNIRFSSGEISNFDNVGEMCEAISEKLN